MVGVPHEHALKLAQSELGDWKSLTNKRPDLGTIEYTGGEISLPYQPPVYANLPELYHMQIGFETTGLLDDDLFALATLQKLLGGGSSFSAGGPGKEKDVSKGGLSEKEVKRAKNQLISSLLMNVESKLAALEDLGRQIQCQDDLRNVAEKVLSGNVVTNGVSSGKPSIVMQGDRAAFGDVEFVLQYFGLGKFDGPPLTQPRDFSNITKPKKFGKWF
ncbi:hypothetical protein QCA50_017585 [Cerrena zonata]|uniref:Peptidase M16 C-terminal domain-containing protein n=1 Tax=Cerrena zonata TaxID=2478898 RepID=A0AAW0FPB7_9APHY